MSQYANVQKTIVVQGPVAAGTSDITGASVVDMSDYEEVTFIFSFGALTTGQVTKTRVASSNTNPPATDTTADLAGSGITLTDNVGPHTNVIVTINKPLLRYVLPWIDRGTQNAVLNSITAILRGPKKMPITADTTIQATTKLVSPAIGAA